MKHIYVDYSVAMSGKGRKGGVAVLVVENEEKSTHFFSTQPHNSGTGELLAFLLGMKFASKGDVVYTDQDWIVDQLMTEGVVSLGKNNKKSKPERKKYLHKINTVLSIKKGVSVVGVINGHKGGEIWNHVDKCAKMASEVLDKSPQRLKHFGLTKFKSKQLMYV